MPSTYTSSRPPRPGARIVVSQYGGAESAAACSYVFVTGVSHVNKNGSEIHTGGISSFSTAASRSGRADMLANTPSVPTPPPTTRPLVAAAEATDPADGGVYCAGVGDVLPLAVVAVVAGVAVWRTNRCLSSASSSLSSSLSNASARSWSTWFCLVWDDALERKDGGGDVGTCWPRPCC